MLTTPKLFYIAAAALAVIAFFSAVLPEVWFDPIAWLCLSFAAFVFAPVTA